MKKLLALLTLFSFLTLGAVTSVYAQEEMGEEPTEESAMSPDSTDVPVDSASMASDSGAAMVEPVDTPVEMAPEEEGITDEDQSLHQTIKNKFIEGGPGFMAFVLIALILGLAFCIERILYLNLATTNTTKLMDNIESALETGGVEAAKEVCRSTPGPVASIFYQGLDRAAEGPEMVEKAVISYGGVQMGLLERGLSWISLFIALAPMLGFFGTVIGMIQAFDQIAAENNISPSIVAGGIGVALITTVSGLLVAMILQVFYNYILAKIDSLVVDMEDKSISLVDLIINHTESNK